MKPNNRKGSFSKSNNGSTQLNELMLRYIQDNQISNFLGCMLKGADIDYNAGQALKMAAWFGKLSIFKAVLACSPKQGIDVAYEILDAVENDIFLQLLNEYMAKNGLTYLKNTDMNSKE